MSGTLTKSFLNSINSSNKKFLHFFALIQIEFQPGPDRTGRSQAEGEGREGDGAGTRSPVTK